MARPESPRSSPTPTSSPETRDHERYRRRTVLASVAGIGLPAVVGRGTAASATRSRGRTDRNLHPSPTGTRAGVQAGTRAEMEPLGSVEIPEPKEAVVGDGGATAFVAGTDSFVTVDVSDPASPSVLATVEDVLADRENGPLRNVYDVKLDGDRLAVVGPANPTRNALNAAAVYDVSDPAAPSLVGAHETDFPIHNCDFDDGVVYLTANDASGNELVAVEAGPEPVELGRWSITEVDEQWADVNPGLWPLHDVHVHEGVAYLAHWDAGTWIVDVSDPADPALVSRVRGRPARELARLSSSEARREGIEPPGNDHYVAVNDDATLLGIGGESWDWERGDDSGGPSGVELWDVSDPTDARRLSTIDPPPTDDPTFGGTWTTSHNFDFHGDRLYTSWYQGGVKIHDVADPTDPVEVAAWRDEETTSFWSAYLAVPGSFFVASSREHPGRPSEPGAVYTFPDVEVSTPTPTAEPTETPTPTEASTPESTPTPTPEPTETPTPTPEPTETPTLSPTETDGGTTDGASGAGGPGFGALAALAGIGIGAWRYLRE